VLLLYLDDFKRVGDIHGHTTDALLVAVTAAWATHVGSGSTLARPGGIEFAVAELLAQADAALCAAELSGGTRLVRCLDGTTASRDSDPAALT